MLDAPLVHRFDLGGRNLVVHLGIASLLTKMLALQELLSRRLARLGRTELDREPEMLGRIIGGAEDPLCYLGQRLHSLAAARTRAHQDQLADEIGRLQRDFLRDHAADREAEHIHLFKPSARMKATALAPICSNVVGTSPELLETPALLNKITSRSRAKPSVTAGSQ